MDFVDVTANVKTTVRCTNVPAKLLEKKASKEYFGQFGRISRMVLKSKNKMCTVQYDSFESAEYAVATAGEFEGETFVVTWDTKKKRSKKEVDPEWGIDPDVKAELEAMSDEFSIKRKYNLRPEGMIVDPEPPPAAKKERKMKRIRKVDKPAIVVNKGSSPSNNEKLELLSKLKQPALTVEDKFRALDVRDKLKRLMRAHKVDISDTKHTVGTCPDMCPEKERLMREVQHQVALYEQEPGERTMNHSVAVKQYSRSSADQEAPLPHELRNVDVLQMTMGYLLQRIMNLCDSPDTNLAEWFHFLWDRTRGIRKDITQQELCCQGSVELVEQCARYHIHCSARLVAEDPSVFDQKINTENLTKCLQTLKYMYHDLAIKGERCPHESEFRAYVILLNLNDGNFMWEVQQLELGIQTSLEIKFALKVYSALDKNNYVNFFKLVRSTTYLNACILLRYFIQVRARALQTIVKCYAPRAPHTQFPLEELNKILAFEGISSTTDFVEYFGLSVNGEQSHVILDKRQFSQPDFPYTLDRAVNIIESKRMKSVGEIVRGKPLSPPLFINHVVQNSFNENGYLDLSEFSEELTEPIEHIKAAIPIVAPHVLKERSNSPFATETTTEQSKPFWASKSENSSTSIFAPKSEPVPSPLQSAYKLVNIFSTAKPQPDKKTPFGDPKQPSPFAPVKNNIPVPKEQSFTIETSIPIKPIDQIDSHKPQTGGFHYPLKKPDVSQNLVKMQEEIKEERRRKEKEIEMLREREMRYMVEVARKKEEKRRLEEARRQDLENKQREVQRLERLRKLAELEKEEEKVRAERLKVEEEMLRNVEIKMSVRSLMDDMLLIVEEDYKNDRLKSLKEITLKRLVISRWKKKIATNRRKRKAIDQSPIWISSKSSKETASELYCKAQDINLILRKRYKQGLSRNIIPKAMEEVKNLDLVSLTGKMLLNNLNQVHSQKHIYWKINISIAEVSEMKISELVEKTFDSYLGWKQNNNLKFLLEQQPFESSKITYCLQKLGASDMDKETDGFIFISHQLSDSLLRRIYQLINRLEEYSNVPIVLMLENCPDDTSNLDDLVDKGLVSNYEIFSGPFSQLKCVEYFNDGLMFLSENVKSRPLLELNTLKSFLMQHLGSELWQRVSSFAKWNCAYKQCLTSPTVVIDLYNQAVEFIKKTVFSEECYKYQSFPAIFRDFLPSKIPDSLPCDYKYFPGFWRNPRYAKYVLRIIDSLSLPEFRCNWPPNDQASLEKLLFNYCARTFDNPEHAFYTVMASIMRNLDVKKLDKILWTSVIEALAVEKINEINFDLTDKTFSSNTVFNQLFVVYELTVVNEYCKEPWFYLTNPAIQQELDESLNEPEDAPRLQDDEYEIDLDKTFEEVSAREVPEYKSQLSKIQLLMEDLEQSMAIQREVNKKFQSSLQTVLDDI